MVANQAQPSSQASQARACYGSELKQLKCLRKANCPIAKSKPFEFGSIKVQEQQGLNPAFLRKSNGQKRSETIGRFSLCKDHLYLASTKQIEFERR